MGDGEWNGGVGWGILWVSPSHIKVVVSKWNWISGCVVYIKWRR